MPPRGIRRTIAGLVARQQISRALWDCASKAGGRTSRPLATLGSFLGPDIDFVQDLLHIGHRLRQLLCSCALRRCF